jgi:lipopolysaccharide export LptBFGC system permease protein LptF
MNNTCPRCGHVYSVSDRDVGKRLPCKKCRTPLLVDASGIRLDEPAPVPTVPEPAFVVDDEPAPIVKPRRAPAARAAGEDLLEALISPYALPTYVMAFGAFLVIVFLFFPLLDQAKVTSRQADISAGDAREARLQRQHDEKKDKTQADEDARKKAKENWLKERANLEDDVTDARVSAQKWQYWYLWGQLFGFLLTALAALAYMAPKMPAARRVVGAIVFVAVVLLVFVRLLILGSGPAAG